MIIFTKMSKKVYGMSEETVQFSYLKTLAKPTCANYRHELRKKQAENATFLYLF